MQLKHFIKVSYYSTIFVIIDHNIWTICYFIYYDIHTSGQLLWLNVQVKVVQCVINIAAFPINHKIGKSQQV